MLFRSPATDVVLEADNPTQNSVDLEIPTANDAVGVISVENNAPEFFPIGNTIVTWTATDPDGNIATSIQLVSVTDTTEPTLIVPQDITSEATGLLGNIVSLGDVTVEDVSGISSITNNSPESFPLGDTIVTWTVQDNYGNIAIAEQIVSVIDTTSPSIVSP